MRWVRFAMLVLFTALLQAGMVDVLSLTSLNIKPDLLIIIMVFSPLALPLTLSPPQLWAQEC